MTCSTIGLKVVEAEDCESSTYQNRVSPPYLTYGQLPRNNRFALKNLSALFPSGHDFRPVILAFGTFWGHNARFAVSLVDV